MPYPSRKISTKSFVAGRRRLLALAGLSLVLGACRREPEVAGLRVGDVFPAFELPDLLRQPRRLSEFLGRPLLINLWATWCPPCREEMAGLQVLHRRLQGSGGGVLAISVDEDINLVREFVLQMRGDFPVLLDSGRTLAATILVPQSYPTSFVVRPDGRVGEIVVGAYAWETPAAFEKVSAAAG